MQMTQSVVAKGTYVPPALRKHDGLVDLVNPYAAAGTNPGTGVAVTPIEPVRPVAVKDR
ncbi:hypothetical protein [Comamonas sp. JC664]|uniref:hypothetical protein n=1 Tax=Comamonas sp. JC664 TaxID=2801917 RepID=UPI00174C3ED2|nr:hypothetical protein [Comamonas sp. JC664]MBL0693183.1 hypothetical protein [Comamonas sp. JC664]GHG97234.1 hypothetical protein GCM10012319_62040 [Comamonas sp. KCTC 72670]